MEPTLTPDELALQACAREFSRTVGRPARRPSTATEQYPWDIVKLAAAGFLGMTIPPA